MKVVYDEYTGKINNIYYADENEPSGYSIHEPESESDIQTAASLIYPHSWGTNYTNTITYQPNSDSFLGTGRATYYTGSTGNRNNKLKKYDCATQKTYDYSKVGDQPITIRNLSTDKSYTYYQADVGTLPDAVIDIWGLDNIHELSGSNTATSATNIRYYHKRFSDQSKP